MIKVKERYGQKYWALTKLILTKNLNKLINYKHIYKILFNYC
jgi:hypothetical protein